MLNSVQGIHRRFLRPLWRAKDGVAGAFVEFVRDLDAAAGRCMHHAEKKEDLPAAGL